MHGAAHWIADLDRAAVTQVGCNHSRLRPLQIPPVLDGQKGVGAGDYVSQTESSVQIALIAAEKLAIRLRIFRDKNHHRSSERLARVLGDALNVYAAAHQG